MSKSQWSVSREQTYRPEARGDAWVYQINNDEHFWGILVDEEIRYKTLFKPSSEVHDDLDELIIPLEGKYWVKAGDWSRTLCPGEMAIIPRAMQHDSGIATNLAGTHFLVLLFSKELNVLKNVEPGGVSLPSGSLAWLKGAFHFLKRHNEVESFLPLTVLPNFISSMSKLVRLPSDNDHPDPLVSEIVKLLEQPDSISLSEISEQIGMSSTHLQKRFSQAMGTSPLKYANAWKLDKIAKDLRTDNATALVDIATEYGFSDMKHFRELFKRRFGDTPSAYRKNAPSSDSEIS